MKEQVFHGSMSQLESNFQDIIDGVPSAIKVLADAKETIEQNSEERPVNEIDADGNVILDTVSYVAQEYAVMDAYANSPIEIKSNVEYIGNGSQHSHNFAEKSSVGKFVALKYRLNSVATLSSSINSNQDLGITYFAPGK